MSELPIWEECGGLSRFDPKARPTGQKENPALFARPACQIVFGIDGGVCAMTNGAVEGQSTVFVAGGNREQGFNDAVYRDIITQKRQFPG
jgi:hypothetical protein